MKNATLSLTMSNTNMFWANGKPYGNGTVADTVKEIGKYAQGSIAVEWKIYAAAPVPVEKQVNVFVRRINKIAECAGYAVANITHVAGDMYSCELVK